MPAPSPHRAPRSDAVRNRARLVEAAARAFRDDGLGVSVNAIARAAGVNVATLYRHFATKDDLIVAVLEVVLEPLAAARDRALAAEDTGEALATFVREAVRVQAKQRGLVDALGRHPSGADLRRHLREPAIDIVTPLVDRAHRDGELRAELGPVDLLVALSMLTVVAEAPELGPGGAGRYVDVVLRGLRPD
jgi:AcrR family transcriptional regulator